MINTHKYNGEVWVDIDSGTPEEIQNVIEKYKIHPLLARELSTSTHKSKIEFHDSYIYCVLHFPAWKHSHSKETVQEIDFLIGNNILITARYDTIDALHKFEKSLEVKEVLQKNQDTTFDSIFFGLLRELYSGLFDELDYIEDLIDDITRKIFRGREKEMVVAISEVTRTLLEFKKTTDLHHDILDSLFHRGRALFGDEFSRIIESIMLDYLKINSAIKNNLESLRELRDTNNSMLSTKQNETMRQLTVMGFITLPLSLIAWIFAMRTEGMPLITNPNAFWIVLTIMATVAIITLVYAWHKKWL